ncbi:MAG: thiol peroxidase [Cyclobacteriaceae bacterium]|nr:thiol peroxidase [Cyclobacteriaceae bacterium]
MAQITLKGNPINTIGELPTIGSKAPDFVLTKVDLSPYSSSEMEGKKVVMNIFPSLDTSTCATAVRHFNAKAAGLENTIVLCISQDLPFAQKRFCGAEGIEDAITLSGFRNPEFAESYGVKILDMPMAGLNARSVVVLDEKGTVVYTEQVPEIGQEPNYEAALSAL